MGYCNTNIMPNLADRSYKAELIDDLQLSSEALTQNLRELAFINRWLGGNALTIGALQQIFKSKPQPAYTIADIGCGGGDMIKLTADYCERKGLKTKIIGIDANQFMINYSQKVCAAYEHVSFEKLDIFDPAFKEKSYDIASLTLFCHHFTEAQLVQLFTSLKHNCRLGFVINDLHRHPLAYYSIWLLTSLFSKSYLVKNDAKLSVWRGFKRAELAQILETAGIQHYSIHWRWAFRWQVLVRFY